MKRISRVRVTRVRVRVNRVRVRLGLRLVLAC